MFTAASAVGFFVFTTNNDHPLAALTCDDTPTGPIYCCSTRAAGQVDTVVCPGSRRARTAPAPITRHPSNRSIHHRSRCHRLTPSRHRGG